MPTAPDREAVRDYIGTNGTYTDEAIDTALAAEIAAQAKVCRLPAEVPIETSMLVQNFNASSDSWWGDGYYVKYLYATAKATATVNAPLVMTYDGSAVDDGTLTVTVWHPADVPDLTDPGPYQPQLGRWPSGLPFELVEGESYVLTLENFGSYVSHYGETAEFAGLETYFVASTSYPDDLLEALLRRVQRLLEMRSKPLGYQDTATEFGVASSRVGPDPEIRRLEAPYRKMVLG